MFYFYLKQRSTPLLERELKSVSDYKSTLKDIRIVTLTIKTGAPKKKDWDT